MTIKYLVNGNTWLELGKCGDEICQKSDIKSFLVKILGLLLYGVNSGYAGV